MPPAICDSEDDESDLEITIPAPKNAGNNKLSAPGVNLSSEKSASSRSNVKGLCDRLSFEKVHN